MGRTAMILDTESVPKYIKEIVPRMRTMTAKEYERFLREGHSFLEYTQGYTFKLYGSNKVGGEIGFQKDAEKLVKWAKSWGASAEIVETVGWWNCKAYAHLGSKSARSAAYRDGFRNYHIIHITDPVVFRFEKDGFYK